MNKCFFGDCRETMRQLIADGVKVQMCVTSPPYFGLRSYMPDAVRIKNDLSSEVRNAILAELQALGITPLTHT
jgi:DNA modification methylase